MLNKDQEHMYQHGLEDLLYSFLLEDHSEMGTFFRIIHH